MRFPKQQWKKVAGKVGNGEASRLAKSNPAEFKRLAAGKGGGKSKGRKGGKSRGGSKRRSNRGEGGGTGVLSDIKAAAVKVADGIAGVMPA